ncbi:hypothetical protein BH11PSE10_BH11PSE10_01510 [soil metagenome]
MTNIHSFARLALASLALGGSLAAQAGDFNFSGQLVYQKDVVQFDFSLATAGTVSLWTDSWQSGLNFDPQLALFDGSHTLQTVFADGGDSVSPTTAGFFDDGQTFAPLAAGHYRLTLSAYSNDPTGPNLANGFTYDGAAPIALADWNQPGYNINANDQKGGAWRVHLSGVEQAAVVPEPASVLMMLAGLLGVAAVARRRRL